MQLKDLIQTNKFLIFSWLLLSIVAVGVWRWNSPYPNPMGWDIYAHQALFNQILKGNINLLPSQISDTFLLNAYIPVFALLLGLGSKILFFIPLTGYYFLLSSLHLFSTIALSLFLAWFITKNRLITVISGIFGALIFESVVAQTAFFITPQNIATTLVVLGLVFWLKKRYPAAILLNIFASSLHLIIGGVGLSMLGFIIALEKISEKRGRTVYRTALTTSLLVLVLSLVANVLPTRLEFFTTLESAQLNFPLAEKLQLFQQWYGFSWIFYLIGTYKLLNSKNNRAQLAGFFANGLIASALLPITYSLKLYAVARYFVHLLVAIGVANIITKFKREKLRIILLSLLFITQAAIFYQNQKNFKQAITYGEIATTASQAELEMANYLKQEYGKNPDILLISDPGTQQVLEGLSTVNTQGGAFAIRKTRAMVDATFPQSSTINIKSYLLEIKDTLEDDYPNQILFVLSGRYFSWQNLSLIKRYSMSYNIWGARDLTPEGLEFAGKLKKDPEFKEVFRNKAGVVFVVER